MRQFFIHLSIRSKVISGIFMLTRSQCGTTMILGIYTETGCTRRSGYTSRLVVYTCFCIQVHAYRWRCFSFARIRMYTSFLGCIHPISDVPVFVWQINQLSCHFCSAFDRSNTFLLFCLYLLQVYWSFEGKSQSKMLRRAEEDTCIRAVKFMKVWMCDLRVMRS